MMMVMMTMRAKMTNTIMMNYMIMTNMIFDKDEYDNDDEFGLMNNIVM